jgi:predicted ArsR family transcriptional regulator
VVDLLERLGFAPSTEPLGDRIYLHACPFAELARRTPTVVCGVHLGLLRGAVDRLGAPVAVTGVDPFVRENLCLVHLGPSTAAAA